MQPNFFRTIPDDKGTAYAMIDYVKTIGGKKVNVIYLNDAYGATMRDAVVAEAKKKPNLALKRPQKNCFNQKIKI